MISSEEELVRSVIYFPIMGLLIGALLVFLAQLFLPVLAIGVLAACLIILLIVITGGLHLDGWADLWDGLAAGGSRERILSVMKDSRIGAFGVMGLVTVLLLKYSLFVEIMAKGWLQSFLIMGLLSRWVMVLGATLGPYAREDGTGRPFIGRVGWRRCLTTALITLVLSGWIMEGLGLFMFLIVGFLTVLFTLFLRKKIGGLTGDALGALNEMTEVMVLLIILMVNPFLE